MQRQSSLMAKEATSSKAPGRRKGWDTMVGSGSGGLGGFLVMGGVLLATAVTARTVIKRKQQQQSGKEAKAAEYSKDTAADSQRDSPPDPEDLLGDQPLENATPLAASVSTSILPQLPAPPEQRRPTAASIHTDGEHGDGVCRSDDLKRACDSRGAANKDEDQPEQEFTSQNSAVSSLTVTHVTDCGTAKVEASINFTEPVDAVAGETMIRQSENETLLYQASDEDDENVKVVEGAYEGRVGGEIDRTSDSQLEDETLLKGVPSQMSDTDDGVAVLVEGSHQRGDGEVVGRADSLLLPKENLLEDRPIQVSDGNEEAKVDDNDDAESDFDANPTLQDAEIPMTQTSIDRDGGGGAENDIITSISQLEDETLLNGVPTQTSDTNDGVAVMVEDSHKQGAGEGVDRAESLPLPKENLPEDRPIRVSGGNEDAKVYGNDDEESDVGTSPTLQDAEIPMPLISMEDQEKNICTSPVHDESQTSELPHDNGQQEENHHEGGDADDNILRNGEDKDLNQTELPLQDLEDSQFFISTEHQTAISEDICSNTDYWLSNSGVNVGETEDFHSKNRVRHEEQPPVEPRAEEAAGRVQDGLEVNALQEKDQVPQDLQNSDMFPSTEHLHDSPSIIARNDVTSDPDGQDMEEHELLLIQEIAPKEERSIEQPTAEATVDKGDERAEVVGETELPSQDSNNLTSLTSREASGDLSVIENESGAFSHKTDRYVDDLGGSLFQDELHQDRATIELPEDKMRLVDGNGAIQERYQEENVSDNIFHDSTGSSTEATLPVEETNSSPSPDEYAMKSQSDIPRNRAAATKDTHNQLKIVFYDRQQELWFAATKLASMIKAKGKISRPVKHARVSFLQLAYPLVGLMLVLLIVCSHSRVFEPYHLLYKFFYPSSSSP